MARIYRGIIQCPYFEKHVKNGIVCEGCRISVFDNECKTREHVGLYCADENGWKICPVACNLNKYYERIYAQG